GVPPLGDQADILGHVRVRGTGPLTIDDLVKVARLEHVDGFHACILIEAAGWGSRMAIRATKTVPPLSVGTVTCPAGVAGRSPAKVGSERRCAATDDSPGPRSGVCNTPLP